VRFDDETLQDVEMLQRLRRCCGYEAADTGPCGSCSVLITSGFTTKSSARNEDYDGVLHFPTTELQPQTSYIIFYRPLTYHTNTLNRWRHGSMVHRVKNSVDHAY